MELRSLPMEMQARIVHVPRDYNQEVEQPIFRMSFAESGRLWEYIVCKT